MEKRKSVARSSVNWPRARKTGQRQMWIITGGDDQMHLWRQVFEQKDEGIVYNWLGRQ